MDFFVIVKTALYIGSPRMTLRIFVLAFFSLSLAALPVAHASGGSDDDDDFVEVKSGSDDREEDDIEDALEKQLEERLEKSEDIEDELEDRLEKMLEDREDLEDELEDELEDQLEKRLDHLERRNEERIERETERLHQLWEIEQQVENLEAFSIPDEFIALLSDSELESAIAAGAEVVATERLEALGSLLVTFASNPENDTLADTNHLYTLDATSADAGTPVATLAPLVSNALPATSAQVIGMMDSSVDASHPCFAGTVVRERAFYPASAGPDTTHGSAVASVIAGQCGLLQGASIVNAAVFGRQSGGLVVASARELIAGLNWLVGERVDVVNLSLSGPRNRILEQALQQVASRGVLLVASSGNEGAAAFPRYPAASPGVIAVTAVDASLNIYPRAVRGPHLAFAAPGTGVSVAGPDQTMVSMDGTSVAAAFATAVLAYSIEQGGSVAGLEQQARDLGAPGRDDIFGFGLLNADKKDASSTE